MNPERIYCHRDFKKIMKMEAASQGMDILTLTEQLAHKQEAMVTDIDKLCLEWNKKYKKTNNNRGFDFI